MADQVRLDDPEALRAFAAEVAALRVTLGRIGTRRHVRLALLTGGAGPLMSNTASTFDRVSEANEVLIRRLAGYATELDHVLTGVAYTAASIASRLPEADAAAARRVGQLVKEAPAAAPTPTASGPDPRFESPVGPR